MSQRYTICQRTKIVEFYFQNNNSIIGTQRTYCKHFNVKKPPTAFMIRQLIKRFQEQGSVNDLQRLGRPCQTRNKDVIERIRKSIEEDPETSTRRRSFQLSISRRSLQRILVKELKLFPYKIQMAQYLKQVDQQQRLTYALKFQEMARGNENFLQNLIMSDESHFHMNGFVNKQNCRIWGSANPRAVYQRKMHSMKCTVWCGVTYEKIIGPYFFEDVNGNAVSINAERYRHMIKTYLLPAVADNELMWFQQDGATAHTAKLSMELLREIFGKRIISRNSTFNWPSRSPDLSAPDYFLWGYLKDKVYINKPKSIQQLKKNICDEIKAINPKVLAGVMENSIKRAQLCEAENGGHLKDIIFKI